MADESVSAAISVDPILIDINEEEVKQDVVVQQSLIEEVKMSQSPEEQ